MIEIYAFIQTYVFLKLLSCRNQVIQKMSPISAQRRLINWSKLARKIFPNIVVLLMSDSEFF